MLIDRYLVREVSLPFFGVGAALLVVFTTYSITSFLAKASGGLVSPAEIAQLTFLKSLIALEVLVPLALYLGIILGLGRLYSDSEMHALRGAGISEGRLLRPIVIFATTMAIVVSLLSTVVRPWAYQQSYDLRAIAAASSELDRIKPGQFYVDNVNRRTVFIQSMSEDRSQLRGIFVHTRDDQDQSLQIASSTTGSLETADTADYQKLTLSDATVYKTVSDGPNIRSRFKSLAVNLRIADPELVGYKVKAQTTLDLRGAENPEEKAEYQWRLSASLSTLLLVLAAVPLSRSQPRQGRYAKIIVALLIYALYLNLLVMSRTWVEQEVVSSIWGVPIALAALVVILYKPWQFFTWRSKASSIQ